MSKQPERDSMDDELDGAPNPYASKNKWRHQESSAFLRHAQPRAPEVRNTTNDLANFLDSSRVDPSETQAESSGSRDGPKFTPIMLGAAEARENVNSGGETHNLGPPIGPDHKLVVCGPLLNYRRMEGNRWIGSVLVVTKGGGKTQDYVPVLKLRRAGPARSGETVDAANGTGASQGTEIKAFCLYSEPRNTFWRFDLSVEIEREEVKWEYDLPDLHYKSKTKPRTNNFFVPSVHESFRIMFHSCNGFSVGTDEEDYSGACLWNDVMRKHQERPFHVMIGGGDQIYNDSIRVSGPLRKWTDISNPKKRREFPFPDTLRAECDDFYLKNYLRWYSTEPFAGANGQIPQVNIWDDHDIIDGFGSYVNDFMKCDVFRGIGGTAHKYYMLFQHHLPPPPSTYTSDAPSTTRNDGQGVDPNQLADTFVHEPIEESNYIVGSKPGPYVAEQSYNIFARLGARMVLLGVDARTERTRHQVNYPETYDQMFARLSEELRAAAGTNNPIKHIILLLGIPIAYPRLTWLENVFSSPIIAPIKLLNRRFGLGGGVFNQFDGSVDLLDDLDDHYTARTHKKERNTFIERLQIVSAEYSARITILGGDVHLAALGRFYSNPKLRIPTEHDYRYMVNVISSAIVNKPPPAAVANLLARRNKIHHLNNETDETLLKLFNKDPGDSNKTANHNQVTMPSRNFAIITENSPNNHPPLPIQQAAAANPSTDATAAPQTNGNGDGAHLAPPGSSDPRPGSSAGHSSTSTSAISTATGKDGHSPLHNGEQGAGTKHKAAGREHGCGNDGSLDICINVEIDQHDKEGRTEPYGLTVPTLDYSGAVPQMPHHHHFLPHRARPSTAGSRQTAP